MPFRLLHRVLPEYERRHSTPEQRLAWEEHRRAEEIREREEIERRLSYLEVQMNVLTRKGS